jgi:hypothetical protein
MYVRRMNKSPYTVAEVEALQAAFLEAMESAKEREGEWAVSTAAIRARAASFRRLRAKIVAIIPDVDCCNYPSYP